MTHPEMTRMLITEQQRDMLARAEQRRRLRFARRQRELNDAAAAAADQALAAQVPDYVDGTFHRDLPAAQGTAVPAARTAA